MEIARNCSHCRGPVYAARLEKTETETAPKKAAPAADALRKKVESVLGRSAAPALLVAYFAIFIVLANRYYPFFSDDALISLRYAERFAHGEGLTWTDGERVEGYTDLLWVLINAIPALFRLDAIAAARVIGFVGAAAAIVLVALSPRTLRLSTPRASLGSGFLATLIPLAVWSLGGLEHGFMAGVIAAALLLLERAQALPNQSPRRFLIAGIPLAALVLLRADGAVLVACALLGLAVALGFRRRMIVAFLAAAAPPVGAWLLQLLFRVLYYGDYLPNTARAKVKFSEGRLELGLTHVSNGLLAVVIGVTLALAAALVAGRGSRRRVVVPLSMAFGWLAYQVSVGGDIFPGWRQVLLGLVPFSFVLAAGAENLQKRVRPAPWVLAGLLPLGVAHVYLQTQDSENQRAKTERWEWDGLSVGPLLERAFSEKQPLLAVDAAGALPFWSRLPSLDLLGLNDRYLALHPPKSFGRGGIGHELGDARYYLDRKPDIFAFCNAAGGERPCFRASIDMMRMREFRENYQMVRVQGDTGNRAWGALYIRRNGKIGATITKDSIEIPGYFLASEDSGIKAVLGREGRLVAPISLSRPGVLPLPDLEPGTWQVTVDATGPVALGFRCGELSAVPNGPGTTILVERRRQQLDVMIAPVKEDAVLEARSVKLTKTNGKPSHRCPEGQPRVSATDLGAPSEGASWFAPPALVISTQGLAVELPSTGSALEVAGDNNDEFLVSFRQAGAEVGQVVLPPVNRPGIQTRKAPIPDGARVPGPLEVVLLPRAGDGRYSVRSVRVLP